MAPSASHEPPAGRGLPSRLGGYTEREPYVHLPRGSGQPHGQHAGPAVRRRGPWWYEPDHSLPRAQAERARTLRQGAAVDPPGCARRCRRIGDQRPADSRHRLHRRCPPAPAAPQHHGPPGTRRADPRLARRRHRYRPDLDHPRHHHARRRPRRRHRVHHHHGTRRSRPVGEGTQARTASETPRASRGWHRPVPAGAGPRVPPSRRTRCTGSVPHAWHARPTRIRGKPGERGAAPCRPGPSSSRTRNQAGWHPVGRHLGAAR